uniref:Odorant receptor n=1 Tax=Eucryptorrhynchus scrobiculatus TaxID=1552824 RepID=A0A8F4MWW0_EUCSC|nr:odorant receptor 38 [Eucryptorrhynchus scrobiculatus]
MDSPRSTELNIVTDAQKLLKFCFIMPYDSLSRKANICFTMLCHLWILLDCSPPMAVVVYQIAIGIEDVYATVENVIAIFNYLIFVYTCICFTIQLVNLEKIFNDIRIFLEFCDITVIQNAEKDVQFYTKLFTVYFCFGVLVNGLIPLMNMSNCRKTRVTEFYQKYDPCGNIVRNLYPFDTRGTVRTFSLDIAKIITTYFICIGYLGVSMVLIGLFIHIIAQIKNYESKLVTIFDDASNKDVKEMKENVKFCVRYHLTIVNYAERVFAVYNKLILVHISITSTVFGLLLFFILKVENYPDKFRYTAQLAGWTAMLFITCYYGQRVTDESSRIIDAAYSCSWYEAPVSLQKSIQIMILRAQRPLTLKAASIGVISLVTFFKVIKGAYSFFTVMVTVSD